MCHSIVTFCDDTVDNSSKTVRLVIDVVVRTIVDPDMVVSSISDVCMCIFAHFWVVTNDGRGITYVMCFYWPRLTNLGQKFQHISSQTVNGTPR